MLYQNVIQYIFNLSDESELKQYENTTTALKEANTRYEETIDSDYATITIYAPRWKKI